MQKPKKVALKIISIATYVVLAFYLVWFALTGALCAFDDGAGYGFLNEGAVSFVQGHIGAIQQLFGFGLPSGILWSVIVYAFVIVIGVSMYFAVKVGRRQQRLICANGVVALYLGLVPVCLTGAGFHLYSDVIGNQGVYASCPSLLTASAWILTITTLVYVCLAAVLWILCRRDAIMYPGEEPTEQPTQPEEVDEHPDWIEIEGEKIPMTLEELKLMIREIVREELEKQQEKPVVNQYFNGVGPYAPGEAPADVAPVAPAPAPAPVEEPAEVEEEAAAKNPSAPRIPFVNRIVKADKNIQEAYNELKNELLAYGAHSRLSTGGDTFRLHRKTYAKVVVAGKGLKIYFALDPKDYADSPIPHGDASEKTMYEEIPFVFKVKSDLSRRRAKQLIAEAFAKEGINKGEVGNVNYVKEIKASLKAAK